MINGDMSHSYDVQHIRCDAYHFRLYCLYATLNFCTTTGVLHPHFKVLCCFIDRAGTDQNLGYRIIRCSCSVSPTNLSSNYISKYICFDVMYRSYSLQYTPYSSYSRLTAHVQITSNILQQGPTYVKASR